MSQGIPLNNAVFAAPLPALIALLMTAGAYGLALRLARQTMQQAAAFITILGLTGALVHALVLLHLAGFLALRLVACLLIVSCLLSLPALNRAARAAAGPFTGGTVGDQTAAAVGGLAVAALGLAALGPVTDPDSLDYHLGVPLDWLRHSGLHLEPHWLHARLTGLGEALNMLGLAAGTDCFGAVLQIAGLLLVIQTVTANASHLRDRLFGLMLVLPPAIVPLATSQKPQLLPAAALAVAFCLTQTAASGFDFLLIFACVGFAVACKYSFAVSGGIVVVLALRAAWHRGLIVRAAVSALTAGSILVLPFPLRNLAQYGDPFSPFLETFRAHPDPEVTRFASYLSTVGGDHDLPGMGRFLLHLLVPASFGEIQTILGIGLAAGLLAAGVRGSGPALAGFALVLAFTVWRGQMASRYLLEAWFWCVPAVVAAPWTRLKKILYPLVALQTAGVAAMAIFAAGTLFPGALTAALRERVMYRSTFGYAEAVWADQTFPPDTVIMSAGRAYALMPRPFIIPECAACGGAPLLQLLKRDDFQEGSAMTFITESAFLTGLPAGCAARVISGPVRFRKAARSPFNSGYYEVLAEEVHCE